MKVLVAAEDSGSLKEISFPPGTNTSIQGTSEPDITTFATAGRTSYVQRLTLASIKGKDYICVARKGGVVELYDQDSHELFFSQVQQSVVAEDAFIGLQFVHGLLFTCTSAGVLRVIDLHDHKRGAEIYTTNLVETSSSSSGSNIHHHHNNNNNNNSSNSNILQQTRSISAFRVHPQRPNIVAFGGKDFELEINELKNVVANNDERDDARWKIIPNDSKIIPRQKLWKAKNVKNDELDLRVPVWVSDVWFLDVDDNAAADSLNDHFRLVISTRFGHVRVYETSSSRKPILNVEVGEHPLVALTVTDSDREVVFGDTHGTTARFSLITGRKLGHYVGAGGSVLSLDTFIESSNKTNNNDDDDDGENHDNKFIATGGLDRFLRVYRMQSRELVGKVYVGTKVSAVKILDASEPEAAQQQTNNDGNANDNNDDDDDDDNNNKKSGQKRRRLNHDEQEGSEKQQKIKVESNDDESDDDEDVWKLLKEDEQP
ncbi:hypothetical protein V1514DRAFT_324083 [Lipomyces japonicus]|uniref:uncharacterized protein n=1 Tax=Lipomyces japonicus TaxID=56871 RepID=UPI0034CF105E